MYKRQTINFDGLTILEPPVDPGFDEQVIDLYHRTMDERTADGRPAGDSRSGRHLLWQLPAAGAEILAAGASDWVVVPSRGGYVADEADFLRAILGFFEQSLGGRPELDPARLAGWLARRRRSSRPAARRRRRRGRESVSYTHLDVYKRQAPRCASRPAWRPALRCSAWCPKAAAC